MNKLPLLLLLAPLLIVGCKKPEPEERSYPVCVGEVTEEDVPEFIRAIGQLTASIEVDVKAQVSGTLTNTLFVEGDLVDENDLLITIDQRPFIANLQSAQSQLREEQARLRYALDFAHTYGTLVGKEYVSRLDYQQGIQNVDVAKGAIEASMAAVELARINLEYSEIRSPTKGYTSLRAYDPGNYVDATKGVALLTVRKVTPILVNFSIPSVYVGPIRERYNHSTVYMEASETNNFDNPMIGEVSFFDNTVNLQTGMVALQGTIPNLDERGWPGTFVRVNLLLRVIENALLVPQSAVLLGQEGHYLFKMKADSTVDLVKVVKGVDYKDRVVVTGDLKPGDTIVTDGQINLVQGTKAFIPKTAVDGIAPCALPGGAKT